MRDGGDMRSGKWWHPNLPKLSNVTAGYRTGGGRAPARPTRRTYPTILMLAAVIGAAADLAIVLIQIGRTAGWWP